MSEILVLVEHRDGGVTKPSLQLLTLARRIGVPAALLLNGSDAMAAKLAEYGAQTVYTAQVADLLVAPKVDALQAAVGAANPSAVLAPSTAESKEIAARLALRIAAGLVTDATDLRPGDGGVVVTQSAFAASYTVESVVNTATAVITVK